MRTSGLSARSADRDPGREPAAADRDHERPEVRQLLDELEPDRALPRDHALVLEGVDERRAARLDALLRGGHRLVEAGADELDVGAVAAASRRPSPSASPAA